MAKMELVIDPIFGGAANHSLLVFTFDQPYNGYTTYVVRGGMNPASNSPVPDPQIAQLVVYSGSMVNSPDFALHSPTYIPRATGTDDQIKQLFQLADGRAQQINNADLTYKHIRLLT